MGNPRYRSPQPFGPEDYSHEEATSWSEPTPDPITRRLPLIGQLNPTVARRFLRSHGRTLAGVEDMTQTQVQNPEEQDERGFDPLLYEMERDDDCYGSGVFDAQDRLPTVNRDMGIFGANYNIPGYIGREVQYAVSPEVSDISTGAEMVFVPSGGATFQEQGGRPIMYDCVGPPARAPKFQLPTAPTRRTDTYVSLLPPGAMRAAGESTVRRPAPLPMTTAIGPTRPMPMPGTMTPVPTRTRTSAVGYRDIANADQIGFPAGTTYRPRLVPIDRPTTPVRMRDNSGNAVRALPGPRRPTTAAVNGFGADADAPGWGTYAVASAMVGASLFMFWHAVSGRPARSNRRRRGAR
jgi:hypothetical protein